MKNIKNMEIDGRRVTWLYDGIAFSTNRAGEGLFYRTLAWDWKQIEGTCQFDVCQKTSNGKRAYINRYFHKRWHDFDED